MDDLHVHGGIIRIRQALWEKLSDTIDINLADTQGRLRDNGVFEEVHRRLDLPESYRITGIFCQWGRGGWHVVVCSPDLPSVEMGSEGPDIRPIYQTNKDGSLHLVQVEVRYTMITTIDYEKGQ